MQSPVLNIPSTLVLATYTIARPYTILITLVVISLCVFDMSVLGLLTNLLAFGYIAIYS